MARISIVLALLLAAAACSAAATTSTVPATSDTATPRPASTTRPPPATTRPPATTPATARPQPSNTTTTTVPPEPTTTTSTTTASRPTEPWQVPGQRYYFPVQPPGVADYGPDHHDYPATDIFAPEGSRLVAVTDGVIDEVGLVDEWDPAVDDPATRSGLYVSIVGDDGVRYYYSHLLAVAPGLDAGTRVVAGQVVGAVGRSGNAASTPPHVHFGISPPTFPGDWEVRRGVVPPYDYLRSWTAGVDATPVLR